MSRRTLERRIVALGLVAMLALPGAALARPGRTPDAAPWTSLLTWFARLMAGIPVETAPPHPAGRLSNTTARAGSTVDPDGRRTSLVADEPPAPSPTGDPAKDGTLQLQ